MFQRSGLKETCTGGMKAGDSGKSTWDNPDKNRWQVILVWFSAGGGITSGTKTKEFSKSCEC